VAGALGGNDARRPRPPGPVGRVSIDSRAVARGELFVGYIGPRHDGPFHRAALDAGAQAAIVAQDRLAGFAEPVRSKLIPSRTRSSRCNRSRKRFARMGAASAAVTGSAGKTTPKEILRRCWPPVRVLQSEGNLNNDMACRCNCCV